MTGPLDGLLVADFSACWPAPTPRCCSPTWAPTSSRSRARRPVTRPGRGRRPSAKACRRTSSASTGGKRSIVLDLREETDLALARELAGRADVFIENLKPGGMAKFGLDFASVARDNPGIVYASISGFGSGEGAHVPGYDLLVQAMSGLMSLTGSADGPGYRAGISVFDVMAGNHAVIGILAALRHREATGAGSTSRSTCSPRRSPDWSTTAPPGWPAGRFLPHGQRSPQRLPLRAVPHCRRGPDRDRRQRPAVPALVRRARHPRGRRGRAVPPQRRPHPAPRRAAAAAGGAAGQAHRGRVVRRLDAGVACGPINTIDDGFEAAERFGRSRWSRSVRGTARCRPPDTRSGSPAPPSAMRCPRPSSTSTVPSCGPGWRPSHDRTADVRDRPGRLQPRLAGAGRRERRTHGVRPRRPAGPVPARPGSLLRLTRVAEQNGAAAGPAG